MVYQTKQNLQRCPSVSLLFLTDAVGPHHGIEVVLHADHGRSVDGAAFEDRLVDLEVALLVLLHHAEDLGQGAVLGGVGLQPGHGLGREHQHAVRAFAAHHLEG